MAKLMQLGIPNGWCVNDNKFCDADPIVGDLEYGFIDNAHEGFMEDVLWIQQVRLNDKGNFETPAYNSFSIDISWLPDSRIEGSYFATLFFDKEDDRIIVEKLESKDRFLIRDKIEFWMDDIFTNYQAYMKKYQSIQPE